MTPVYENHGIQFQYPENWTVVDESSDEPYEIFVESPSGAFWSLRIHASPCDPSDLVFEVRDAMKVECEGLEDEPAQERISATDTEGCDMLFFCREFVVQCRTRGFTINGKTFLLVTQAEDRDYERLEPVFLAMTTSLLRGLEHTPSGPLL